ncbi:hypothetical protein BWI17_12620 [Betaproteobacteria bacterium GR16-43]|nr:hypothetical protein BWI17_12620 [Betaproteobacteria bacterium GR16-43]
MTRALFAAALAFASAAANAAFDEAELMRQLAATTEVQSAYTERKTSPLLAAPLDNSGTLTYRRPNVIEKNVASPRREKLRILADEVVVERNGQERRIAIASQPTLAAFAASLRGVLSGDSAVLRKYFKLRVSGAEEAWSLELVPIDAAVSRYVERVVVEGRGGRVGRIETFEVSGDRTVLELR